MQKRVRSRVFFILTSQCLYKETLLNINDIDSSLPSVVSSLSQEFKYVFLKDDPSGLPPEETKEIQCQV